MKFLSFLAALCLLLLVTGCSNPRGRGDASEIVRADSLMSVMAQQDGFHAALLHYAADDFTKLNDGEFPVIGKEAYRLKTEGKPGTTALQWQPVKGELAASGELGYTWGNWKFTLKDTTIYGNYFSVWRKSSSGEWKLALDGGNTTPPQ